MDEITRNLLDACRSLLREHDIMSENDPSVRAGGDRWPTAATKARAAISIAEEHEHKRNSRFVPVQKTGTVVPNGAA